MDRISILKKTKDLIGEGFISETIDFLLQALPNETVQNEIILLKSQYEDVSRNRRLNLQAEAEIAIQINRIRDALLELVQKISASPKTGSTSFQTKSNAATRIKQGLRMKKNVKRISSKKMLLKIIEIDWLLNLNCDLRFIAQSSGMLKTKLIPIFYQHRKNLALISNHISMIFIIMV